MKYTLLSLLLLGGTVIAQTPATKQHDALEEKIDSMNVRLSSIQSQLSQMQSMIDSIASKLGTVEKVGTWFQQSAPPTTASSTPSESYGGDAVQSKKDDADQWVIHEAP